MTELCELESQLIAAVTAAGDEAALDERAGVGAGQEGRDLRADENARQDGPGRAQDGRPGANALKDKVADAIAARSATLKDAALEARLAPSSMTSPCRSGPN